MRNAVWATIVASVAIALQSAGASAEAACPSPRLVATLSPGHLGYLFSPGQPFYPNCGGPSPGAGQYPCGAETSYYINGWFWSFGSGNPDVGLGNDNGVLKGEAGSNWLWVGYYPGSTGGAQGTFLGGGLGHWAAAGTDGCIDLDGSDPVLADPQQCNVVVLEDFNGPEGAFAVFAKNPDTSANYVYNGGAGPPFTDHLDLVTIPKPHFVGSNDLGNGNVQIDVVVDCGSLTPEDGYYLQCPNTPGFPGDLRGGYRIYGTTVPSGDKPVCADSRVVAPGGTGVWPCSGSKAWVPLTGAVPCGEPVALTVPCSASEDLYLCSTLLFGGNAPGAAPWELKYCSTNSSPVECDPNTADPQPKPELGVRDRRARRGVR
jgi:hypothetical protein